MLATSAMGHEGRGEPSREGRKVRESKGKGREGKYECNNLMAKQLCRATAMILILIRSVHAFENINAKVNFHENMRRPKNLLSYVT